MGASMPSPASPAPKRRSARTGHKTIYSPPYELVVARMREVRLAAGLSQEDLADRLGRTQLWVSRTERGERRVDLLEWIEFLLACEADLPACLAEIIGKVRLPRGK